MFIVGYLLGSIPWGYLIVRWKRGIDIRNVGSGNIGATNVYRVLGLPWAILVFFLDALKGALPVLLFGKYLSPPALYVVVLSPFIGHCYSLWLGGRGGKGVATSAGILIVLAPLSFLLALAVWLVVVYFLKLSSAGSVTAAILLPIFTYFLYGPHRALFTLVLSLWVLLRHRENIRRLISGEESTRRL